METVDNVQLPERSASKVMMWLLKNTKKRFPEDLSGVVILENLQAFSKKYPDILREFEMRRAVSPGRADIAAFITDETQNRFLFGRGGYTLRDHFQAETAPVKLEIIANPGARRSGYRPLNCPRVLMVEAINAAVDSEHITYEAEQALYTIEQTMPAEGIVLKGQKFALLGGAARLSPLVPLLRAGADVMTTWRGDRESFIQNVRAQAGNFSGRLFLSKEPMDLLEDPAQIAATIASFAENTRVHLGLFAYAGGQAREWRLAAAQDGIARKLQDRLASVNYYLSPSVPMEIDSDTADEAHEARKERSFALAGIVEAITKQKLAAPPYFEHGGRYWTNSIVSPQGVSYAAANLFGKIYAAERFSGQGIPVSANTAPISDTDSMQTPLIRRAFAHVCNNGIKVFQPDVARDLMFMLMVHDHRETEAGRQPQRKDIHGGIFTAPVSLESALNRSVVRSCFPV